MKKILFLLICCFTFSLSVKAQAKLEFKLENGKTVETISPKELTPVEVKQVLNNANYTGRDARYIPVHVYYFNHHTGFYDYQYSGELGYPPGSTLGDIIDFILSIWDYL